MTFLPIVDRELRVAARRWFTFWGRLAAAAFALLVFGGLQSLAMISHGMGFKAGQVEFNILKWLSFLFAASAGLFLTSDSLSEEKREGTLGLLFLTDLRGYDVVLGKLISSSLQSFYGLLAVFPILGLTILAGGVAGSEFGDTLLVICNTLFLSLCIGLFVSSISRDFMKAINASLFLNVLIYAGLPLADFSLAGWDHLKFRPILSAGSPGYLFSSIGPIPFRDYWYCLGIQHGMAWLFLALSCVCTPRAWQEKANQTNSARASISQRWRFGGSRARKRFRQRLLETEPLLWLGLRDRWLPRLVWLIMGITLIGIVLALLKTPDWTPIQVAGRIGSLLAFGLLLWTAAQASRFFIDAIRTGALELILVAPVGSERVVRSEWSALWRTFLVPALLLMLMEVAGGIAAIEEMKQRMVTTHALPNWNYISYQIVSTAVEVVKLAGNFVAVAWFGMWMGVTTRKVPIAVLKTLAFVLVLPGMAIWFVQIFVMMSLAFSSALRGVAASGFLGGNWPFLLSTFFAAAVHLGKNVFFVFWARRRLLGRFREAMLREQRFVPTPPRVSLPPPLSPPPIVPAGVS